MKEADLESGVISRRGMEIVGGKGARIKDSAGREYIDMGASYGVCNVGHCNPDIRRALKNQIDDLIYVSSSYDNPRRRELMSRLTDISPRRMERVFLCNSGTESVEAALKFAIHLTGKKRITAARRSFHGRTMGSLSVTWNPKNRKRIRECLMDTDFVRFGDIEDLERKVGDDTAALILEPVQGEGGVHPAPRGYLSEASRICHDRGALLIVDEVQTGFGRCGSMFAVEREGICPDMMCLGKSLGGGLPVAATIMKKGMGPLPTGLHGSTFGGGPAVCAAASAVIDNLISQDIPRKAKEKGKRLLKGLRELDSPLIREVRGVGLMAAVELRTKAGPCLSGMLNRGVAAIPAGSVTIRLLPPLVISDDDLDETVRIMGEVLDA